MRAQRKNDIDDNIPTPLKNIHIFVFIELETSSPRHGVLFQRGKNDRKNIGESVSKSNFISA